MILMYEFFKFPIYMRSRDKYYQAAEKDKQLKIAKHEVDSRQSLPSLPDNKRLELEARWQWPPWEFNDVIGYVDIGMDAMDRFTGDIYLMLKYIPKIHPSKLYYNYRSSLEKQKIHYFQELNSHKIEWRNNDSYREGVRLLLDEADKIIKNMCKTKSHKWILQKYHFSLDCIDFVTLAFQVNPNFPKGDH